MRKFLLPLVILLLSMGTTAIQEQEQITEISALSTFMSSWNTTLTSTGSSNSNQIKLPLESDGNYNFVVNWGDETSDTITSYNQAEVTHTYSSEGIYNLTIDGTLDGWRFNNVGDKYKIIDISQWGNMQLGNNGSYFHGAKNLQISAIDAPDLLETTNLGSMFAHASSFNQPIDNWDVSSVTNMSHMFILASSFNQSIGTWDVSSVIDMSRMFVQASSFNQPIGDWDVSSVTHMGWMLGGTSSFNQDIGNWDVNGVTDMSWMFESASSFNQPIGTWDVSSVTDMGGMFISASSFNQPISNWDVSRVTDMLAMFYHASSFNQDIGNWDVLSVNDMSSMFNGASDFNQDLGNWNVSNVYRMYYMFYNITLSTNNYDNLLINWAELPLQSRVEFDAGFSLYSDKSAASRQKIIDDFGWKIADGGPVEPLSTSDGTVTIISSGTEETEAAFLNASNFYILSSWLVIAVILIRRRKKKYQ